MASKKAASPYPSVDCVARFAEVESLIELYGRSAVIDSIRGVLDDHRGRKEERGHSTPSDRQIGSEVTDRLKRRSTPSLKRVFNLTGTVLHTGLGRALLSDAAIQHACMAMREACNLEFDLDSGGR